MSTPLEAFRAQFDPAIYRHLVEFGKRISTTSTDVFMTMARKATCLVECMETLGLTNLDAPSTSDRVLDMDPAWFFGKRVTLIDDALITGTTICRTEEKLRAAGAASVTTLVLCVNERWWARKLITPASPYLLLSDQDTVSVCARIVDAISVVPMPYSVDYPFFTRVRVPSRDFSALLGTPFWHARDVSTPLQCQHGVFSITCIPTGEVMAELDDSLGWDCSRHALTKIRIYGRVADGKREPIWCSALPIVGLKSLRISDLERIWSALMLNSGQADAAWWTTFTTPESKLRLVQYVGASRLARIWRGRLQARLGNNVELNQNHLILSNLFPPPVCEPVSKLAESYAPLLRGSPEDFSPIDPQRRAELPSDLFLGEDGRSIQARLTRPFVQLFHREELPTRERARILTRDEFLAGEARNEMNRLRTGYSLHQLTELVQHLGASGAEILSVFLDEAIDRGVVVPLTVRRDDVVFRAYRHGEDVGFGEAEARLCGLALAAFARTTGRQNQLPHIWVEKLFVLLIRILVQRQLLVPANGSLGAAGTVGVRYSLHGAVVQRERKKLYGFAQGASLLDLLAEKGILRRGPKAEGYSVGTWNDGAAHSEAEREADSIGEIIGHLEKRNRVGGQKFTDRDLILVASCLTDVDLAGALAAEIDIFHRRWVQCRKILIPLEREATPLIEAIRGQELFMAINSGEWKFTSARKGKPWRLIRDVGEAFGPGILKNTWDGFWPPSGAAKESGGEGLSRLVDEEGEWCLKAGIFMRMAGLAFDWPTKQQRVRTVIKEILHLSDELETFAPGQGTIKLVNTVMALKRKVQIGDLNREGLHAYAIDQLDILWNEVHGLLARVDACVSPFGYAPIVRHYEHALHIQIETGAALDPDAFKLTRGICEQVASQARRATISAMIEFPPERTGTVMAGSWAFAIGEFSRRWLVGLAVRVLRELPLHIPVRCTLFANLSRAVQLVQRERETIYRNERFWERAEEIIERRLPSITGRSLVTVTESQDDHLSALRTEIEQESRGEIGNVCEKGIVHLGSVIKEFAKIESYEGTPSSHSVAETEAPMLDSARRQCDLGIITILLEETRAVKERLETCPDYDAKRSAKTNRKYYRGTLVGGNISGSIACTQALDQGNLSVISAFRDLQQDFQPRWFVLLGIAGGIHKDVGLCDVVIADSISYYERRAEEADGAKRSGEFFRLSAIPKSCVEALLIEREMFDASTNSSGARFRARLGPLGSGEAVVKYREAEVRTWLHTVNRNMLAVETEAGGFGSAFHEAGLSRDFRAEGWLVFRGISDHADHEKNDDWRKPAAANAFIALEALLPFLLEKP